MSAAVNYVQAGVPQADVFRGLLVPRMPRAAVPFAVGALGAVGAAVCAMAAPAREAVSARAVRMRRVNICLSPVDDARVCAFVMI